MTKRRSSTVRTRKGLPGREHESEDTVASIDPEGLSPGPVLGPMKYDSKETFPGWETPLAPWGGFGLDSGLSIVKEGGKTVLELAPNTERAIVTGQPEWRDYRLSGRIRQIDAEATPNTDRNDWKEALSGLVFRIKTSRSYYHFGAEGRRRLVLYRRTDDEWLSLCTREVELPEGYIQLEVRLDGDGIRCSCKELGVRFFVTDTMHDAGKAGFRGIGRARISGMKISMSPGQRAVAARRSRAMRLAEASIGREIPDAKLVRTIDCEELGGTPVFSDFAEPERYDMLVCGGGTRALTLNGELLWEIDEEITGIVPTTERSGRTRLLYGLSGIRTSQERPTVVGARGLSVVAQELCVVKGDTGEIVARREVPEMDPDVRRTTLTTHTGSLSGSRKHDIILREWSAKFGDGGENLWAFGPDLEPLWDAAVKTPYGHGHAIQFVDVDGDGYDEVLAGGTLFSSEGEVLWIHDLAEEMSRIHGAHHYDAVTIGNLSGDSCVDPVAFLLGGSAGVYILDGLTGETRMVHRIGHAQGRVLGKVRSDLPGREVLVACRWGNMGILTLFSGRGDRLWSIQPDYLGQGSCPVKWGEREEELIWANTSGEAQAFYDGHGRRVKDLPELREAYGDRMRREVSASVVRAGTSPQQLLGLRVGGKLHLFGPVT